MHFGKTIARLEALEQEVCRLHASLLRLEPRLAALEAAAEEVRRHNGSASLSDYLRRGDPAVPLSQVLNEYLYGDAEVPQHGNS